MKPTLLIIAAGMGSRYGGLKQIDPVGPNGEIIIDYSIYDAIEAGFEKIVFVIRHYFEDAFRERIGDRISKLIETDYAFQEMDLCLGDFKPESGREKPWGTGHAILVAKDVVDQPFAVINADDYYGPNSFRVIKEHLSQTDNGGENDYSMVGYILRNTLSEYGAVSRGVCEVDGQMFVKKVTETTKIEKDNNAAKFTEEDGTVRYLTGDETVSMNFWGFKPSIFGHLQRQFDEFLAVDGGDLKKEFCIPTVVDSLVETGQAKVKVLHTDDQWFGITYKEDKPKAIACIDKLIEQGRYPKKLWN